MKAKLISYELTNLDQYHKVLVNRDLFGYTDNSNNGSYQYKRKGVLNSLSHFKLKKGVIIVKNQDQKKVSSVLNKHKVKHMVFNISIKQTLLG